MSKFVVVNLYELKTYHEVVDEIYYKVQHLEPWEKGSRRTSGQTGMCGGVRGVGAGGIVSTAYCLLYKLFTLKLTRKQLNGLITHCDSPYIRALGFMYIRYVLPPASLADWYEPYLDDEEEMDVKAGGGQVMKLGMILRQWMVKLEWFSTLFPRIPVPIQQKIQQVLGERFPIQAVQVANQRDREDRINRQERPERFDRVDRQERNRFDDRRRDSVDDRGRRDAYRKSEDGISKDRREKDDFRERRYRDRSPIRERERERDYHRDRDRERDRHDRHGKDRDREHRHKRHR